MMVKGMRTGADVCVWQVGAGGQVRQDARGGGV